MSANYVTCKCGNMVIVKKPHDFSKLPYPSCLAKDLRSKFLSIYPNLPIPERSQVIVIIDDEPYSWNVVYNEVKANTELGKAMLEKMNKMELI